MTSSLPRRTALRGAAVAATVTVASATAESRGKEVRHSFTVRDNRPPAARRTDTADADQARAGLVHGNGAVLTLNDSKGRPRIVISVGTQDVPSIRVLDEQGAVISSLP